MVHSEEFGAAHVECCKYKLRMSAVLGVLGDLGGKRLFQFIFGNFSTNISRFAFYSLRLSCILQP